MSAGRGVAAHLEMLLSSMATLTSGAAVVIALPRSPNGGAIMDHPPLKVLCVFQDLPVPGSGHNKEGVYPQILKAHSLAGVRSFAVIHNWRNFAEKQAYCADMGVTLIEPAWRINVSSFRRLAQMSSRSFARPTTPASRARRFLQLLQRYRAIAGIDAFIKEHGSFDVMAALTAIENTGQTAAILSLLHKTPFVVRENRTHYTRGMLTGHYAKMNSEIAQLATVVLPISKPLGFHIAEALKVDFSKIIELPNPVADWFFDTPSDSNKYRAFREQRFCFAGWTNWRDIKRIDLAVQAFSIVHAKMPKTCMIIAGAVSEAVKARVIKMGLSDVVWFTGQLNRQEIHQLAHACDCCIVPSDHDPGNNSVLEAMAAGKPVVVTRCGGAESWIIDCRFGRVVNKGDPKAFATAMEDVINSIDTFESQLITEQCRSRHSVEVLSRRLNAIYAWAVRRQPVLDLAE